MGTTLIACSAQGSLAYNEAIKLCKGSYQLNLIKGFQNWSGSDLKGKAKNYSGRYKNSRTNLLKRLAKKNVPYYECLGNHGKRVVILGVW